MVCLNIFRADLLHLYYKMRVLIYLREKNWDLQLDGYDMRLELFQSYNIINRLIANPEQLYVSCYKGSPPVYKNRRPITGGDPL